MLLIASSEFEAHTPPPGHPESPERGAVFVQVAHAWTQGGGRTIAPRAAAIDELARVHTTEHLASIRALDGRAAMLDPDTFTSPETYEVARLAAGAAIQAAMHALDSGEPALALVRPPGHHAESNQAMGFCFFNNVAVAAAAALQRGLERVAIVDIDVHHGNGTQQIFYADPRVLYVSTHQFPFYPGTGASDETGTGAGSGLTLNLPMEAGATDADYAIAYEAVSRVLSHFDPQLLFISAGFDAHRDDPLASMRLSTEGYAAVLRTLVHGAACPVAAVTEGGYDLAALNDCLVAAISVLSGESTAAPPTPPGQAASRGATAVAAARAAHPRWRDIL